MSNRIWLTSTRTTMEMPSATSTCRAIRGRSAIITAPTSSRGSRRKADVHSGDIRSPNGVSDPSPK